MPFVAIAFYWFIFSLSYYFEVNDENLLNTCLHEMYPKYQMVLRFKD